MEDKVLGVVLVVAFTWLLFGITFLACYEPERRQP